MNKLLVTALVLLFAAGNAYAGGGPPTDDLHSVPEPSTLLLLAAGLGAMAWRLRKRS
jgi:hypothetical protein